ncbi:MAG: IS3 family transposase, partial [Leptotrichiaceae bacterium]
FDTIEEIKVGVFEYIEKWYNRERIQEKIGYLTPVEFEEMSKKNYIKSAPNIWVRTNNRYKCRHIMFTK